MDLTPTTTLAAVNAMLRAIGESPVNSLEDTGIVDVVLASQTLEYCSRNIQERGWSWNTLEALVLPLDPLTGEIRLPANTLKVDTTGDDEDVNVAHRGNRLFNKSTNTFTFDGSLTVDLVEFLAFEDLPQAARTFTTYQAVRKFQQDRLGSDTLAKFQEDDEKRSWAQIFAAEAEALDASIFDNYSVTRVLDR